MYRWFIVWRYLHSRVISFAALVVVASSVALLIIIVSVMEGFRSELKRRVRGTSSDLKVESTRYIGLKDPEFVARTVEKIPGVRATAPYVETLVLYRPESGFLAGGDLEDRYLRAVDLDRETLVGDLADYVAQGALPYPEWPRDVHRAFSREWAEAGLWEVLRSRSYGQAPELLEGDPLPPSILVGIEHRRWYVRAGDQVRLTAYSPQTQKIRSRLFLVVGFFKTGLYEMDSKGIFMERGVAEEFLGLQRADGRTLASGVRVALEPRYQTESGLDRMRLRVAEALDEAGVLFTRTLTWKQEKAPLLRAVQVEKTLVSVVFGMIVLFTGFMIFIILTVQVVEKTRDLGVLQSMGVTPGGIAGIYFSLGIVLCLAGTIIGTVYGVGFSLCVNTIQRWIFLLTGWEVFSREVFYMDSIPVEFQPFDLLFIIVPTVVASLTASLIPAYRAARKDPVVALRYE